MDIRKQQNGDTRITLSDTELIDALENYFNNVYENITENGAVKEINTKYGDIEIIIGE